MKKGVAAEVRDTNTSKYVYKYMDVGGAELF